MNDYDLFISYHSADHESAEEIDRLLRARRISTFLDQRDLPPGTRWRQELEKALERSRAIAVLLGREIGNWQDLEIGWALGTSRPVIPVLLPGAEPPKGFLEQYNWMDLRAGIEDVEAIDNLVRRLSAAERTEAAPPAQEECPFKGLSSFQEEDEPLYFGRAAAAQRLLDDIVHHPVHHPVVMLVGTSGSGKSSLARAGLLPRLRRQKPPDTLWDAICFAPGNEPFFRLAKALMALKGKSGEVNEVEDLAERLSGGKGKLEHHVEMCLERSGRGRLLIVVDQLEELFTQTKSDPGLFLEVLLAPSSSPLHLLFTLRADFYDRVLRLGAPLGNQLLTKVVHLLPMQRTELAEAIEGPAKKAGLTVEPALLERLLNDVGDEPGNLPLLEFALTELWKKWKSGQLTLANYEAVGGIAEAISHKARGFYEDLPLEKQKAVRSLFTGLVRISPPEEGARSTRRQVKLTDLGAEPNIRGLAETLAGQENRLLVLGDERGFETVTLAHEALIQHWDQLQNWLDIDREFLLWRERLRASLNQWKKSGSKRRDLLSGTDVSEAKRWRDQRDQDLSTEQQRFIRKSVVRRCWNRIAAAAFGLVLLGTLGFAYIQSQESKLQQASAIARSLGTQVRAIQANQPQLALLLGLEALRLTGEARKPDFPPVEESLRSSLASFGGQVIGTGPGGLAAVSPDGRLLTLDGGDRATLWRVTGAKPVVERPISGIPDRFTQVALSRKGSWLVAASAREVSVWNTAEDGKPHPVNIGDDPVLVADFSPDGHWLVTRTTGGPLVLWSLENLKEPHCIFGSGEDIAVSYAFTPDEKGLVTGGSDGKVRRWSLSRCTEEPGFSPDTTRSGSAPIVAIRFGMGRLVTADADRFVRIWSWPGARPLTPRNEGPLDGAISADGLQVSPDSHWLAAWSPYSSTVYLWNLPSGEQMQPLPLERPVTTVRFSPDSKLLATASLDRTALLWPLTTSSRTLIPLRGHTGPVRAVEFSPDGEWVATASDDRTVRLWRTNGDGGEPTVLGGHDFTPSTLIFLDDRSLLSGSRGDRPRLWNLHADWSGPSEPTQFASFPGKGTAGLAAIDAAGAPRLVIVSPDRRVVRWNLADNALLPPLSPAGLSLSRATALSSQGRWLADAEGKSIHIWDLSSGEPIEHHNSPIGEKSGVTTLAVDPSGRWLAVGLEASANGNAEVHLWELETGTQKRGLVSHREGVQALVFSPDGRWLATGGGGDTAFVYDLDHLDPLGLTPQHRLEGNGGAVSALAFGSKGLDLAIAVAASDRRVRLWRAVNRKPPRSRADLTLNPPADLPLRALALAPSRSNAELKEKNAAHDAWSLAAGDDRGTVYLWHSERYPSTPVALRSHHAPIGSAVFSSDGLWLVTADTAGTTLRWSLREEDLFAFACQTVGRNLTKREWADYFPTNEGYRQTCPDLPPGD